ncbi:uncharacterized protein LOC128985387 isoform X2 [Macrosteles quadrilineatus]|uniref:uncharacterized protein LOC128985387 isoform X2 n=1 Tax=Macrosteles quadrilineatus TaxID=74068 RepID=UPI0023E0E03C|nr:uncharacterized protein LOC128985387 isoform X2 [Macrosteles quadrilineatus]
MDHVCLLMYSSKCMSRSCSTKGCRQKSLRGSCTCCRLVGGKALRRFCVCTSQWLTGRRSSPCYVTVWLTRRWRSLPWSDQSVGFYCKVLRSCVLGPLTVFLWLLLSARDCNLLTQRASWSGQMSVSWSADITLAKVTRVKQVTRSTVNCVLLSALAGALRILLQSCGVRQPPDLRVVLPVDLRTDSRLGNQMAPVVVSLPVGVEGAVPRLWSTRRALRTLRQSSDALIVYLATAALMTVLPAHSARSILSAFTEQKASLQFSSLIGPSAAVLVGGCPLRSVYSLLPAQTGLSVAVSVLTYADQVFVAVATDSSLQPAGDMILNHLQAQVELMYSLLKNRRVPGEAKTEAMLYRFPDVTRSPVRELASRLTMVQGEVERLSRSHSETSQETEKLHRLRAEFSHLLRELRKRKSLEGEPWDVQWRSRRRAMSCSFSRRPSMSVISLLSTVRPASVIETSAPSAPAPLRSTIAYNDAPSTSVFNVNYSNTSTTSSLDYLSSPLCAPDESRNDCTENDNCVSACGLYNEILTALESNNETLHSFSNERKTPPLTNNISNGRGIVVSEVAVREHNSKLQVPVTEINYKYKSNLRKYKSRTMTSIYEKSWSHRYKRQDAEGRRMSRSCNLLNSHHTQNYDYEAAIESLSEFATKIRRLSLENASADKTVKNVGYNSEMSNFFYRQKRIIDKSRRHSMIPERRKSAACQSQQHREEELPSSALTVQPCIYEFV